jgi:hypothetical protein
MEGVWQLKMEFSDGTLSFEAIFIDIAQAVKVIDKHNDYNVAIIQWLPVRHSSEF